MRPMITRSILPLVALLLLLSGCATNPVTGKKDFVIISEQQEIQMGMEADPAIVAQFGLYPNDEIQQFITEKGLEMAKISHRPHLNYEFKVLDSPVVNAFAVPGGYVYFTRGILAHFNNEAQFAGVLGHEIGHVTARHTVRQQSSQFLFQAGFIAGILVAPDLAQFADVGQQALGLIFLKFSRDHESESDELGVEYSTKINYDAHEMADFFQTLKRVSGDASETIPTFLSTHPDPVDRYNKVNDLAKEAQAHIDKSQLEINRNSYLEMIDGLTYGEDPRQGFVEANVFYHPELKFLFPVPANWALQNSPLDVRMASKDGNAMMIFSFAQAASLEEAAQQLVQNNNLQVVDTRKETVNGFPSLIQIADQVNPQNPQQVIRIITYFIQDGQSIYRFHGLSMAPNFPQYSPAFNSSMSGFKRLTDQDKLNRLPDRLDVVTVRQKTSVQDALRQFGIPSDRLEEFAILNGMQLGDNIDAGSFIKVLQRGNEQP